MATSRTLRKAQVVQWSAYFLAAVLLGFLWTPFLSFDSTQPDLPRYALSAALAGFFLAAIFRGSIHLRGKEPSMWLAVAFPLIGSVSRSLAIVLTGSGWMTGASPSADFLQATVVAYSCMSVFVIPLAIAHLHAIRWLHRSLQTWSLQATGRKAHHAAYAVGCVALLLVTEGRPLLMAPPPLTLSLTPRYLASADEVSYQYGFELPSSSQVVFRAEDDSSYWIRPSSQLHWPLVGWSQPVSEPESDVLITQRAEEEAHADSGRYPVKVRQIKWYTAANQLVRANLVRCGDVDYLEIRVQ